MKKIQFRRVVVTAPNYKVSQEKTGHTRFVQVAGTGQMRGRRIVPANSSDRLGVLRMTRDFDVNKDGDTNDKVDLHRGQIIGRQKGAAKPQRVTIRRHWAGSNVVKTHTRRIR